MPLGPKGFSKNVTATETPVYLGMALPIQYEHTYMTTRHSMNCMLMLTIHSLKRAEKVELH